jgi:hypothetical protein
MILSVFAARFKQYSSSGKPKLPNRLLLRGIGERMSLDPHQDLTMVVRQTPRWKDVEGASETVAKVEDEELLCIGV